MTTTTTTVVRCLEEDDDDGGGAAHPASAPAPPSSSHNKSKSKYYYAVMVHRVYRERVQAFLMGGNDNHNPKKVRLLATTEQQRTTNGLGHQNRHHHQYRLLLLPVEDEKRFAELSPFARQNVSWVGRITHQATIISTASASSSSGAGGGGVPQHPTRSSTTTGNNIGSLIWNESLLPNKANLENNNMRLRVDCHPREQTEDVCRQLQEAALASDDFPDFDRTTIVDAAYDGPIPMTASATQCTHRLTIVVVAVAAACGGDSDKSNNNKRHDGNTAMEKSNNGGEADDDDDDDDGCCCCCYYWGLADRRRSAVVAELKLNSDANGEVRVTPTVKHPSTRDAHPDTDPAAPVSRAYYKLHQVWQEHRFFHWTNGNGDNYSSNDNNNNRECECWWRGKAGLDVGAAPGGWTQVLVHCAGLSHVTAVDAGRLADRVARLPQVVHVPATLEQLGCRLLPATAADGDGGAVAPYSVLVCDASVRWDTLLDLLLPLVKSVSWTQPALAVVTLKLPFKRTRSIRRHVRYIEERVPGYLKELTALMYPDSGDGDAVPTRHYLVHLMANTEQERTLIVHFGECIVGKGLGAESACH